MGLDILSMGWFQVTYHWYNSGHAGEITRRATSLISSGSPARIATPNNSTCRDFSTMDVYPIGSMYAIYGNIYHQYTPNVSIYTIHGSYEYGDMWWYFWVMVRQWGSRTIVITISILNTLWLWLTVRHGKIHPFFIGKPSISMGHLYHGYVSHKMS